MARFKIYSSGGTEKAQGCPTFTGTYMKSGVLDFREIGSPTPISWTIGDYVDYTRTGLRYYLYGIPQIKRQASNGSYGGAFVYQNVQLHDSSYDFEICPFRDLIVGDNRVHFSTQPSISVFDNVAGIAERIQACLDDMFPNKWDVRVASGTEYDTLMAEEREFSVSGVTIKGVLDKVYEVWPEVGWVFSVENGTCVLTIGGAWQNTPDTYTYGKGNGLISLSRSVANADELANRLFVFGSNRNMLPKWYNSQDIKDANSVDIQHLMLPVGPIGTPGSADYYPGWGKTDVGGVDKPDPAKAYIQDDASIAARGLRPNTVYFDGSGDYKEIYPTIREMTIGELRSAKTRYGDTSYVPAASYGDSERIDKVLAVNSTFDAGLAANNGKETVQNDYDSISVSRTATVPANSARKIEVPLFMTTFSPVETGEKNISLLYEMAGTVNLSGINSASMEVRVRRGSESGSVLLVKTVDLVKSESAADTFIIDNASFDGERINITSATLYVIATIVIDPGEATSSARTITVVDNGTLSFSMTRYRAKSFSISLRQIGFDINEQANLGDGKTISMRSGACVGRTFRIASATYISSSDTWNLEVIRSNDESLSQWFPNSSYPIVAGDEFVLLDIAMPATYVSVAEERLLTTARELLSDTAKERWQYTPDIDAKFMDVNSRSIQAGDIISITDNDIVGDDGRLLVDSVTISEGDSTIPTYKVTIRERKRKNYTDKASVPEPTSNPVTDVKSVAAVGHATNLVDTFFEEDGNGNIKLKDEYGGFWAQGFVTAGGIGSGGGGGGDITLADVWRSLTNNPQLTPSDIDHTTPINALHIPIGSGLSIDSDGNIIVTAQGTVTGVALGSGTTPYSPVNGIITLPAYPTALASPYALTVGSKTYDGSTAVTIDKSDIGLGNVTNDAQVKRTEMGAASGVATLGSDGKVPSSQLPSYVDDVLEYADLAHFPATGESGKIYIALDTNKTYRWSGTAYVEISPSIVIGTTTGTAFDGGSGYSHVTNGDIHVTATQKTAWSAKYDKPNGGIPNTDLANSAITINGSSTSLGGSFNTASITAGTAGTSSATSGYTLAVPYVTMNQYGIVTGYGTHTHTVNNIPNSSLVNSSLTIGSTSISLGGTSTTLAGLTSVTSQKFYLDSNTYFELDSNGYVHLVHPTGKGFYADGFITAGGVGSGGGGGGGTGLDVTAMYANLANATGTDSTYWTREINVSHLHEFWKSLQNNDNVNTYDSYKIHTNHLPSISGTGITGTYSTSGTAPNLSTSLSLSVDVATILGYTPVAPSALADYLPLTGGTLSGYIPLTLNNNATGGSEVVLAYAIGGTQMASVNYHTGLGLYLYNSSVSSSAFVNLGQDGVLKMSNAYPFLHSNNYSSYALPLSGGTMSGSLAIVTSGESSITLGSATSGVSGAIYLYAGGSRYTKLVTAATGSSHTITFPNADGTVALTSDLSSYLPLTGGIISDAAQTPLTIQARGMGQVCYIKYESSTLYPSGELGFHGQDIPAFRSTGGTVYSLLHSGNYSSYALSLSGGTMSNTNLVTNLNADLWHDFAFNTSETADYNNITWNTLLISVSRDNVLNKPFNDFTYGIRLKQAGEPNIYWADIVSGLFNDGLYYRRHTYNGYFDWHQIAFTDSNVASATKLQTARTIFGCNFDGAANVVGVISDTNGIEFTNLNASSGYGGYIDFHFNGSSADYTSRIIEIDSGLLKINNMWVGPKVGVGTNNPTGQLTIEPGANTSTLSLWLNSYGYTAIRFRNSSNTDDGVIHFFDGLSGVYGTMNIDASTAVSLGNWQSPTVYADCVNKRVGIGTTSPTEKLDVAGDIKITNGIRFTTCPGCIGSTIMATTSLSSTDALFYCDNKVILWGFYNGAECLGNFSVTGTIHADGGIDSNSYVTAGAAASSSDIRLKKNIASVTRERAKEVIMALNPCEWTWNDKHYKHGQRGAGMVAQEVEPILPFAILQPQEYKYLEYDDFHAYEIKMLQSHETELEKTNRRLNEAESRIAVLESENAELKARLNA